MKLAREGWEICAAIFVGALLLTIWGGSAAWPLWGIFFLVLQFFREPVRNIPQEKNVLLSPADGRVVFVGEANSPINVEEKKIKISVFMNVFNVHSNRSPVAGKVVSSQHFQGSFFNAALDKASEKNERQVLVLDSEYGEVICVQIAGLIARRILCYAQKGSDLKLGERYGFIRFGSRVDVYLPTGGRPSVMIGDKVSAGLTRLAEVTSSVG